MTALGVLLASDDPGWLLAAEDVAHRAGHVVIGDCADEVSLLAQASLGLADAVLLDPALRVGPIAVHELRRSGLAVAEVGPDSSVESMLAWLASELGRCAAGTRNEGQSLIAVFGCKGAPGATTLAIDLARMIGQYRPVALVDLDRRGGDIGSYLRLPEHPTVVSAAQAIAHGAPWHFTVTKRNLSVLAAPSRPEWDREVVPADVGLLLDDLALGVIDGGSVESEPDEILRHVLARATSVVLVGGASAVADIHLVRAQAALERFTDSLQVVTHRHPGLTEQLARGYVSDTEEKRQPRKGVEKHQEPHGLARRQGSPLRWLFGGSD
ncbi:MAG TPA: hypothetical protein VN108_03330 [Marmoricola sp.]|nr:hypothetical protein [Marmoricola sp.]